MVITRSEQKVIEKILDDYSDELRYIWDDDHYIIRPISKSWKSYYLYPDDKTWCNPKAKVSTYYPYKSITQFIERYVLCD